ncbi:MAG: DUF5050 domain-containing protein [Clostridia bacterium]|nr:DUF5050 domain-containing protein [Clostridia bacterium]
MIFKNNYRPAFAGVSEPQSPHSAKKRNDGMIFNTANSDTDDFNAFDATPATTKEPKKKAPKSPKKKLDIELNSKTLLIAAAALVAVVLLIVMVVVFSQNAGSSNGMKMDNNSFVAYEQDGLYYVAMNGEVIGAGFENELSVTPAADNSFAYVVEDTPEGFYVYVLQKKELTQVVPNAVSEVIALAEFEPGVVYRDEAAVYFYADKSEERITKNITAGNFVVAPDASAVAYTQSKKNDVNQFDLFLFQGGFSDDYADNMYPVEVSAGGKFIYAYGISSEDFISKKLYAIPTGDNTESEKLNIASGFDEITYANVKGTEIIYTVGSAEAGYTSYIYNIKKNESHKIGAGKCVPLIADPSIACLDSLKDIVVENTFLSGLTSATYRIDSKYESQSLSKYNGKLNSDGDMFYFVTADNILNYIDLDDKNRSPQRIAEGVVEYVVTEKNNIYYIDEEDTLRFYKASSRKRQTIARDVTNISMNKYSNVLYFEIMEDTKAYMTEEGSGKRIAEFNRAEIKTAPEFIDTNLKRTFTYVADPDLGTYDLYYTSTGSSYKLIAASCTSIYGIEDYENDSPNNNIIPTLPSDDTNEDGSSG